MDDLTNLLSMLNQKCPQCKSSVGDIISYMPIIQDNTSFMEIEIECERCGCYGKFITNIQSYIFKPSIGGL